MKVWLMQRAEPLPTDEGKQRLLRTGMLAQALADCGHEVLWWTSTFDHYRKKHRSANDALVEIAPNYRIYMLHGTGYRNNVSLLRLLDQRLLAWKFKAACIKEKRPDVIFSSLPSIEMSLAAVEYGKKNAIPTILDMRDMWPDIFVDFTPFFLRPFVRLALSSMFRDARRACAGATAICGITEPFVDWGIKKGSRFRTDLDRSFPMAHTSSELPEEDLREAGQYWDDLGISEGRDEFVVCFLGSVSWQLDVGTVIRAVRKCEGAGNAVKLVVCGDGDKLKYYRRMARHDKNIIFTGWVNAAKMHILMRRASLGLDPLPDRYDFLATINNKAVEYMSAGLPILSSPKRGELFRLLKDRNCGVSYGQGDEKELAALIAELASNKNRLREMSVNALGLFNENFTAEKVYMGMMKYLERVVTKSAGQNKAEASFQ